MKAVKSLFAKLLLVAALVFAMTASASADEYAPAVFKTTPFEAVQNGTVSTVLYLEENSNLIDFEFQLEYDTEFVTLQSAEQVEDLIGDMTITQKDGAVHISYTRTSANLTKKTDLAVLTFTVDENVGPDSYDFLRVDEDYQSEAHTMIDGELYALPIETEFAPLNIYNFGDVDLSHTVSIADVTYLRQHLAEIRTLSDYQLGRSDTYYDTNISIADAVRIQQYLANKSMLLGNRVNVTFMDKDGAPYRVKSVVQGSGLASIPALPTYTGYYGGVWSIDPDEVVGSDFQNLTQGLNVYAIYKKDASQAVTFYKERLTDVYYSQNELTGNLNLVNKLTWQDGYTADIYWSSSNSAVLNASTGVFNKPSFDTAVTLTATIISYQDGSIEAQDYIAFEFNAAGDFLCPTKEAIAIYLQNLFIQRVESNMILPSKITNADMAFDSKFEVRLSWLQQNADGTEQSVVQLERGNNEQTVNLTAIATFNGQPLEDDGKIHFDNVVIAPITISEVRSHIVTRIASTSGLTVTEGLELLGADEKYATTIVWESKNTKVADVDDNIVHIKDVVNGTALPLTAHVSYECAGEAKNFDLAYTVNVVTDNTTLVPGTNIDPDLYDALKSATGVSGNLTTDALKDVKFVYLDLSGYPEIEDLSALTYCTNLRVLNISGLKIDETSLNQIVTLNKLEALIASNCGIDSLTIGGVPVLDKMINLQMLDLSHNKLTSLDGIFSRDNRYGQLLELFLHDNELTDISALCEVVENTVELKDSEGNVTGTYTENVIKNRAPMLRFLTLDNNYLGDEDLTAFGNFKVLKYLSLGHNNISSVSSLKNVRTLLELHLQDNRIEDVRDLRYLDHLQSLYLSGNNIRNVFSGSKEVNVSYLKYLTDLEILYLDNNYIEDISDLAPLDNLLVLNANNNQLQDLSVLADKGETLVELYAENNDIDSFSFVRGLPNLTRLMLSGNGSVYEASLNSYLSGLTKLRTLTLSGKDLRSLSFLSAMPQLVRLDVAGCNLPSYTITSSENNEGVLTVSGYFDNIAAISALRGSLQYLDVSNNGLAYGADAVEQYLAANGKQVQVDSVAFAGAAPVTFESLYEMTLLKAFYADNLADPVDAKQLFSVMNGLRYLSMENCGITNTDWLSKFRSLIYLDLAGNQLAGFDLGSDIALRSRATLEYLYVDSAEEGEFSNAYSDFDDNVLKEFSASNLQINTMESMPDMSGLTYLNLANSGITDLSGNAEFEGWYNLSRYANLQTLDLTGIQADLDEVKKLDKLQTMYAIGGVEDTVFQKQNLLTLYELDKAGVACYLYGYEARYLPRAEQEGGLILGRLEDYSRALTVAADGIICDNNPTFVDSVNNFEIEWTLSNNTNYAIVDNQIVVVDYTDLDDEKLIVTATIDVYPDQDPVSRDFVMDMDILRADKMDYIKVNADNAQEYLTRGAAFTYDVSCVAAETKGFESVGQVLPVYTDIVYTISALAADGETVIPYSNLIAEGENHTYTIDENAPLGAKLTIKVEVGHTIGGKFMADTTLEKVITISDRVFTLTLVPNGGVVTDKEGNNDEVRLFSEEAILFENFSVARTGFIFDGWFTDADCTQLFWAEGQTKPAMPSNDLTLYAKWTAHNFDVYFDANSGEVDTASKGVLVGMPYGTLPTPAKTGYTFLGWFTAAEGGDLITAESIVAIEADQTLYAHWQVNTYTVTFHANGGNVSPVTKTVTYGQTYGDLPTPTRTGFSFAGWYSDWPQNGGSKVTKDSKVAITADQTLIAYWWANSYSSNWTASGTGYNIAVERTSSPYAGAATGMITSGTTLYYGDVLKVYYMASTGYYIAGNGYANLTVTGNVTSSQIYMSVNPNNYTYNVVYKSTNGTHLGSTTVTYAYGTTNTIYPIGFTGYSTPGAQTVAWDSTSAKTITFVYPPSWVGSTAISGTFMSSSPKVTYSTTMEYQNRTATSVQVRMRTTATIQTGWNGYAHGIAYNATCGSVGSGRVTVAAYNALSKAGSSSSGSSGWITIPLNTTGATTVSFGVYMYQINIPGDDISASLGYSSNNYTWTMNIPAF